MFAVYKKELKSYFLSPIGYVVVGILLLVASVFFYLTTVMYSSIDLGGLYFYTALYGLLIAVPLLTMRMFSEERKTGTEQLVLTSPVSITGVVLGKFLAAMAVITIIYVFWNIVLFWKSKYISSFSGYVRIFINKWNSSINRNVCIKYNRKPSNCWSSYNGIFNNNIICSRPRYRSSRHSNNEFLSKLPKWSY